MEIYVLHSKVDEESRIMWCYGEITKLWEMNNKQIKVDTELDTEFVANRQCNKG